jgi:hypothetical protein
MRLILFIVIFASTLASATTLISPSSPCHRIIQELRAGKDLRSRERFLMMRDVYERALISSLTAADLEGLLNEPLTFRNWSTSTLQPQVGEILDFLRNYTGNCNSLASGENCNCQYNCANGFGVGRYGNIFSGI